MRLRRGWGFGGSGSRSIAWRIITILTVGKRARAVALGAVFMSARDQIKARRAEREATDGAP